MSEMWDGCVKIHENCGGVCRWVEAIDRRGVDYTGECTACGKTNIPVGGMIPIEFASRVEVLNVAPCETLELLEWSDDDTWEQNQERLGTTLSMLLATEGVEHEQPDHIDTPSP